MSEFKSFDDFLKEQHRQTGAGQEMPPADLLQEQPVPKEPAAPAELPSSGDRPPVQKKRRGWKLSRMLHRQRRYWMGASALLLMIILALLFLPIPLGTVRIAGNSQITMDDVVFEGRLRQPLNVLQISTSDLQERLSHDLRISSVSVVRELPFAIDISVTERVPLTVIQSGSGYAHMDAEGRVIQIEPALRKSPYPMITGKKLSDVLLGDRMTDPDIQKALLFISHLSAAGLSEFSEVNIGNPGGIVAYTRDGIAVRLGDGSQMEDQAGLAENMVSDVRARKLSVEYIDANTASPYIRLKK